MARKQSLTHEDFLALKLKAHTWQRSEPEACHRYTMSLITQAVSSIREMLKDHPNMAYAWSGGKDSEALRYVCELAGIIHSVLGMTYLEYPAFLQWVTVNMPDGLTVINTGLDLPWLAKNQHMLFPQTSDIAAKWFALVQHKAQSQYYKDRKLDGIILGRRVEDGNYIGRGGQNHYVKDGVLRFSPIAHWSHYDIFLVLQRAGYPEAPFYSWPRGYRCGTHSWAARQWTGSIMDGWQEIYDIDPTIVTHAADVISTASQFLQNR